MRADLAMWLMAGVDDLAEFADSAAPQQPALIEEPLPGGRMRRRITGGIEELKSILRMKVG